MVEGTGTWNSLFLEITYQSFGWIAFAAWASCFYPQLVLNYKRKSVVGLNFDFVVFNLMKHSSYLIYNASMFFSPVIHRQYHEKYGEGEVLSDIGMPIVDSLLRYSMWDYVHLDVKEFSLFLWFSFILYYLHFFPLDKDVYAHYFTSGMKFPMIPVAVNDVALSTNSVAVIICTVYQLLIYDRGNQKVSKACLGITTVVLLTAVICVILAWPNHSWLWLISVFNTIQVFMAAIKYIPQAFMNFCRKSTVGWSIRYILLDITGGLLNLAQMGMQSIDQGTLVNFYGNFGKTLLSIEVVMFDVLFILQHYVLYPVKDEGDPIILEEHITPLIHPEAKPDFKNV